jgi:transketolase
MEAALPNAGWGLRTEAMTAADTDKRAKTGQAADIDRLAINTIRTLAIDAVEKADSGHAGAPMGLAPVAYTLWTRFLNYDAADPSWPGRDRFVLSAGHASMLLYSLLHLSGVRRLDAHGKPDGGLAVRLEDIEQFRQLGSVTPGHPEYRLTTGVETTTGPLGQGCGNSVGMAIAERWLEQRFNRPGLKLFGYNVYVICSDGDMMEGVSSEAASVAGHLKLSNLCWIYDDNHVTIEGHTDLAFTEDVSRRFQAYGWSTLVVEDANDCEAFARAIETFQKTDDRPTFIRVRSVIGYGSPHKQGTSKIHSDALGEEEVRLTKQAYGWPEDEQFLVPDGVRERFHETLGARGHARHADWKAMLERYRTAEPGAADELAAIWAGRLPAGWDSAIPAFPADAKGLATRDASSKVLNAIAPRFPWLLGGSADLAPSNKTLIDGEASFEPGSYGGRNLHYGVREHAMGAISNGLATSGLRPYTGTFLTFSDYMRPPIRLSALMEVPVVFIFTHDSIGLGEDGPTHQPIEQLAGLRAIPGMSVVRPCDANETAEAWRVILGHTLRPACLVLTRQKLPTLDRSRLAPAAGLAKGAYVLADSGGGAPEVILMGTGSEVILCVEAHDRLAAEGVKTRVVSMPSWDLFEAQDQAYRDSVLPSQVTARVAVEAAAVLGWDRYVGPGGDVIGMRSFGMSAPIKAVEDKFGFTADHVVEAARRQLARSRNRQERA